MNNSTRRKLNFFIILFLIIVMFIMINYISARQYRRFDLTKTNIFTISGETKRIITKIKYPLKITVFMSSANIELYEQIKELLLSYQAENSLITVEYINPVKDYEKTQFFGKKYNLQTADAIVFDYDGAVKFINYQDIVEIEYIYGSQPKIKSFKGEHYFSNTILSLIEKKQTVVYFTTGHGELKLTPSNKSDGYDAMSYAKQNILEKKNFLIKELQILTIDSIPSDCAILGIINPQLDFTDKEIFILNEYKNSGGKIFICLEPSLGKTEYPLPNVLKFIEQFGIFFHNHLIIDSKNVYKLFGDACFAAFNYSSNPMVSILKENNIPTLFNTAAYLSAKKSDTYISEQLISSSDNAIVVKDISNINSLENKDAGIAFQKLIIAYHIKQKSTHNINNDSTNTSAAKYFEAVIFSDADFFNDLFILQKTGNSSLFLNIFNYLSDKKDLISLPPKTPEKMELTLASADLSRIFIIIIVAMPLSAIIAGIGVWRRRKK